MMNWSEARIWITVVTIQVESEGLIKQTFERKHPMALSEKYDINIKKEEKEAIKIDTEVLNIATVQGE